MVKNKKEKNIEGKFERKEGSGINAIISFNKIKRANGLGSIYTGSSYRSYKNTRKSNKYNE